MRKKSKTSRFMPPPSELNAKDNRRDGTFVRGSNEGGSFLISKLTAL